MSRHLPLFGRFYNNVDIALYKNYYKEILNYPKNVDYKIEYSERVGDIKFKKFLNKKDSMSKERGYRDLKFANSCSAHLFI